MFTFHLLEGTTGDFCVCVCFILFFFFFFFLEALCVLHQQETIM